MYIDPMEMENDKVFREARDAAQVGLEDRLKEQSNVSIRLSELETEIEAFRNSLEGLNAVLGESSTKQTIGISDAIRAFLKEKAPSYYSPVNLRNRLKESGFPMEDYKQPLAVIHTTLKRLEAQGDIESYISNGRPVYHATKKLIDADNEIPF